MTMKRCDECDAAFDSRDWHPAALGEDDQRVYEFCSQACKRQFLGGSGPVSDGQPS